MGLPSNGYVIFVNWFNAHIGITFVYIIMPMDILVFALYGVFPDLIIGRVTYI